MKKLFAVTIALALTGLSVCTQAAITVETVTVGDPGNIADTAEHSGNSSGQGAVSYTFKVGKYEITAGQYTAFLNAVAKTDTYGLYNGNMWSNIYGCKIQRSGNPGNYTYSVAPDWADRPVNYVSFWDACRFANWLHNGQPTGAQDATTTERGAYTLDGYTGQDGRAIQRNAGWIWAVPSEDEWYKAAYYKGGGTNAGYWLYPTQSDDTPGRDLNDTSGNNANYQGNPYPIQSPNYYTTVVGEFQNSESAYVTFDQGGNVWEWNEATPYSYNSYRGIRGGSFSFAANFMSSTTRGGAEPNGELYNRGFRLVCQVPEPSSAMALLGGLTGLIRLRRPKR